MPSVRRCLSIFTLNVPYRFLSPWIPRATNAQVEQYSREFFNNCPYAIAGKEIMVDEIWAEYLTRNASILKDYSFWNLSIFLQKRNSNVPDIPSKLVRPLQRAPLSRQHRFWDRYIQSVGHIHCIYTNAELTVRGYDLDHFIPWKRLGCIERDPRTNCLRRPIALISTIFEETKKVEVTNSQTSTLTLAYTKHWMGIIID